MKTCSKCKIDKPLDKFPFSNKKKRMYHSQCKYCGSKNRRLNYVPISKRHLVSKAHFSKLTNKSAAYISEYVKRGILNTINKKIDLRHPLNKAFLNKYGEHEVTVISRKFKICKICNNQKCVSEFIGRICKTCTLAIANTKNKLFRDRFNNEKQRIAKVYRELFERKLKTINTSHTHKTEFLKRRLAFKTATINKLNKYKRIALGKQRGTRSSLEQIRLSHKKYVENLSIGYVTQTLRQKGFSDEMLIQYPQIIEAQKLIIKTKRL